MNHVTPDALMFFYAYAQTSGSCRIKSECKTVRKKERFNTTATTTVYRITQILVYALLIHSQSSVDH